MKSNAVLQLENVSVSFGDTEALRDLSISVGESSMLALVGPSGAGKTTLLRLAGLALLPSSGVAYYQGCSTSALSIAELRQRRSKIGFIHQRLNMVPNLRVYQNVLLGKLGAKGLLYCGKQMLSASRTTLEEIYSILKRLGVEDKMYSRTDRLSGGQLQRVAIARALFQSPTVLLADEPVSSVDPARAEATIDLLVSLAKETNTSLLVSMHNYDLAAKHFSRLVGLKAGGVLFDAAPADVSPEMQSSLYSLESHELLG